MTTYNKYGIIINMSSGEIPSDEQDPGYLPMQISRVGDKLQLPDGTGVLPNISVGPKHHHLELFIEYERTFGRGQAKYLTHASGIETPKLVAKYGAGFRAEYLQLAAEHSGVYQGTEEEVAAYIEKLLAYRMRHPKLYEDAKPKDGQPSRIRVVTAADVNNVLEEPGAPV